MNHIHVNRQGAHQYDPIIVTDQYGNEYVAYTKYEAENVVGLLKALSKEFKVSSGDWFTDIPVRTPKDWVSKEHANNIMSQIKSRISNET